MFYGILVAPWIYPLSPTRRSSDLARDRVLGPQPFGTLQFGVGALGGGLRARELRAQAIDFRLERTRVDLEQQVAAVDHRAFVESHGRDQSRHTRADVHGIDGLEPSGEFIPLGHVAFDDAGDGDLWWRRRGLLRGCSRAAGGESDNGNGEEQVDRPGKVEAGLPTCAEATVGKQVGLAECLCAFHVLQSLARVRRKQSGSGRMSTSSVRRRSVPDLLQRAVYDFWTRRSSSLRAMTSRGQSVR